MLIVLFLAMCASLSSYHELWGHEHYEDIILYDSQRYNSPAKVYSVVVLYDDTCDAKVKSLGLPRMQVPDSRFLILTGYNSDHVPKEHWFDFDDPMDEHFEMPTCPSVYFVSKYHDQEKKIWKGQSGASLGKWILNNLKMKISFVNNHDHKVRLFNTVETKGKQGKYIGEIAAKSDRQFEVSIGDIITVKSQRKVIFRTSIQGEEDVTIYVDENKLKKRVFYEKQEEYRNLIEQRIWSTRRRHLMNMRAPPIMPGWTDLGFKRLPIPREVYSKLLNYWNDNKHKKTTERFPKDGTQLNINQVPTHMVHLPQHLKLWVAEQLKPILEEVSGEKLQYSILYGLREYHAGAVIKGHTDRVETHIISALLHITHEPDETPWEIEVRGFDGKRHRVVDKPGEMLYYESSKLIHGRPVPFTGNSWVNCFLHFRPINWKGYSYSADNKINVPGKVVPIVDHIYG